MPPIYSVYVLKHHVGWLKAKNKRPPFEKIAPVSASYTGYGLSMSIERIYSCRNSEKKIGEPGTAKHAFYLLNTIACMLVVFYFVLIFFFPPRLVQQAVSG